MWMLMEGVVLYVALVRVFIKKQTLYIAGFTIISYGKLTCITIGIYMATVYSEWCETQGGGA